MLTLTPCRPVSVLMSVHDVLKTHETTNDRCDDQAAASHDHVAAFYGWVAGLDQVVRVQVPHLQASCTRSISQVLSLLPLLLLRAVHHRLSRGRHLDVS